MPRSAPYKVRQRHLQCGLRASRGLDFGHCGHKWPHGRDNRPWESSSRPGHGPRGPALPLRGGFASRISGSRTPWRAPPQGMPRTQSDGRRRNLELIIAHASVPARERAMAGPDGPCPECGTLAGGGPAGGDGPLLRSFGTWIAAARRRRTAAGGMPESTLGDGAASLNKAAETAHGDKRGDGGEKPALRVPAHTQEARPAACAKGPAGRLPRGFSLRDSQGARAAGWRQGSPRSTTASGGTRARTARRPLRRPAPLQGPKPAGRADQERALACLRPGPSARGGGDPSTHLSAPHARARGRARGTWHPGPGAAAAPPANRARPSPASHRSARRRPPAARPAFRILDMNPRAAPWHGLSGIRAAALREH